MKKALLILFIFSTLHGIAQVPGYQGLRFSVAYDLGFMHPVFEGRRGVPPYLYHNGSIDYVVTRSISICLRYGFMLYRGAPNFAAIPQEFAIENYYPPNYAGKYTQHTVSFLMKKFFRNAGYIAPVGRFFTCGAYYQYAADISAEIPLDANYNYTNTVTSFRGIAQIGGVVIGGGRNFIVANRLIIDLSGVVNLPCFFYVVPTNEQKITYRDIVFNNLLQLDLGLGVLAF